MPVPPGRSRGTSIRWRRGLTATHHLPHDCLSRMWSPVRTAGSSNRNGGSCGVVELSRLLL